LTATADAILEFAGAASELAVGAVSASAVDGTASGSDSGDAVFKSAAGGVSAGSGDVVLASVGAVDIAGIETEATTVSAASDMMAMQVEDYMCKYGEHRLLWRA
jgi:hypothetical protein